MTPGGLLLQLDGFDHLLAALTDDQEGGTLVACFQSDAVGSAAGTETLASHHLAQAVHERDGCVACGKGIERGGNGAMFHSEVDVLGDCQCACDGGIAVRVVSVVIVAVVAVAIAARRRHRFAVGVVVGVITGVSPDGELVISGVGVLVSVGIGVGVSVGLKSVEPPARAG